MFTDTVKQTV